jgi:peptidoglycan/LPS O-acetylase OafA/YrhL
LSLLDDPVRRDRSPGIDCLRGLFALWVVFGHVIPWALYVNGTDNALTDANKWFIRVFESNYISPPVLGFIVLSGYCIHRNGLRRKQFDLRAYRTRRVYRIVPVYLLGVVLGVALLGSDPAQHALTGTTEITFSGLLYKLTAISALVPSTFEPSFQGNAPLVTVAAEMWLYAFYAVIITRQRALWLIVPVAWVSGIIWTSRHPEYVNWWHIGSLPGFLPYWWLGALFVNPDFILRRRPQLLIGVFLAFVALTVIRDQTSSSSLWLIEAYKVAFAMLVGGATVALDGIQDRVLAAAALVGRSGYSIYALHAPIVIALLIAGVPWILTVVIAVAVAMIVFVVYERPLLRRGAELARQMGARPTAATRSSPSQA